MRTKVTGLLLASLFGFGFGFGCAGQASMGNGAGGDGGTGTGGPDAGPGDIVDSGATPNLDAFWEDDPPAEYCGPGDAPPWDPPGGTPECPDDKNREGCPCDNVGETAPCWPGLRADRDKGICHDGTTECIVVDEVKQQWGPCVGYQLPVPGATEGAAACNCFSYGRWEIDNLSPCFVTYSGGQTYAVSTFMVGGGNASCPTSISSTPPPAPQPGQVWATNRLTVDCAGEFQLCYTLKAGDVANPLATDCVLAQSCVDFWYDQPGVAMELPPLPSWSSPDTACAAAFANQGGYGEMSVVGTSIECEPIDDGAGNSYVFNRVGYCSLACNDNPTLPGCENCSIGGSGSF